MVEQKEQEEFVMSDLRRTTYNNIVMNSEVLRGSENPHTSVLDLKWHRHFCRGFHKLLPWRS